MSLVDTVPADATGTQQPGRRPAAADTAPGSAYDLFAVILAQTFQSSERLDALLAQRADSIGSLFHRQQRADALLPRSVREESPGRDGFASVGRPASHEDSAGRADLSTHDRRIQDDNRDDSGSARRARPERPGGQESDFKQHVDRPVEDARGQAVSEQASSHGSRSAQASQTDTAHAGHRHDAASTSRSTAAQPAGTAQPTMEPQPGSADPSAGEHHNITLTANEAGAAVSGSRIQAAAQALRIAPTAATSPVDGAQAGAGARGLAHAARPVSSPSDFLNVLQQAGRARLGQSPVTTRSPGGAAPAEGERGFNLQRSESVQEMARVVRSTIGGKNASMTLRLDPPELGQLRIDVRMHDQTLEVRIEADTKAGHDMLRTRLGQLRQALESQGVRLDQLDVQIRQPSPATDARGHDGSTFSGQEQDGGSTQQSVGDGSAFQDRHEHPTQSASEGSASNGDVNRESEAATPSATHAHEVLTGPSGVDVTV